MAAQDQSLYNKPEKYKNEADHKCRMCDQYDETVDRLVSGCPAIVLLNIKADITESVNTSIRRFSYITNPHTIKAYHKTQTWC